MLPFHETTEMVGLAPWESSSLSGARRLSLRTLTQTKPHAAQLQARAKTERVPQPLMTGLEINRGPSTIGALARWLISATQPSAVDRALLPNQHLGDNQRTPRAASGWPAGVSVNVPTHVADRRQAAPAAAWLAVRISLKPAHRYHFLQPWRHCVAQGPLKGRGYRHSRGRRVRQQLRLAERPVTGCQEIEDDSQSK